MTRLRTAAAVLLLVATVVILGTFDLYNNDLGYHIAYGEWIVEHRALPRANPFSTVMRGAPTHDDKWLFQLLLVGLERLGGATALVAGRLALVGLLAGLTFGLMRTSLDVRGPLPWLGCALTLWAMDERFLLRPELVSYVLIAGTLWQLERLRAGRGRLWPLALMQIVWVNCHGYYILGPSLVGAALVADGLAWIRDRDAVRLARLRRWGRALALVVACCLATPHGVGAVTYPLWVLGQLWLRRGERAQLTEFRPSLDADPFPSHAHLLFLALLVLAPLAMLIAARRQPDAYPVIVLAAFVAMSLTIRRNIVLLGLVGSWQLAVNASRWTPGPRGGRVLRGLGWAALFVIGPLGLLQVATDRLSLVERRPRRFGVGLSEVTYPAKTVRFLRRAQLSGVYWNHFDAGSYLLWQLGPTQRPIVDSNLNAITPEFQLGYKHLINRVLDIDAYAERYGLAYWVVQHGPSDGLDIVGRLHRRASRWALVHLDPISVVFVRRKLPRHRALIARAEVDLAAGERAAPPLTMPPPAPEPGYFWRRLLSFERARLPHDAIYLADLYAALGCPRQAAVHYRVALVGAPWDPRLFNQVALLLAGDGQQSAAADYLEAALRLSPRYAAASHNLGLLELARGRRGEALRRLQVAADVAPERTGYVERLVPVLAETDAAAAELACERGLAARPDDAALHRLLGDLLAARGARRRALAAYRRSLELRADQPELLRRIEELR